MSSKIAQQLAATKRYDANQAKKAPKVAPIKAAPIATPKVAQTYASRIQGVQQDVATVKQQSQPQLFKPLQPNALFKNDQQQSTNQPQQPQPKTQEQSLGEKVKSGIAKVGSFLGAAARNEKATAYNIKQKVTNYFTPKPEKSMVFNVGDGLDNTQPIAKDEQGNTYTQKQLAEATTFGQKKSDQQRIPEKPTEPKQSYQTKNVSPFQKQAAEVQSKGGELLAGKTTSEMNVLSRQAQQERDDEKKRLLASGMSEEEATKKALFYQGDAGKELGSIQLNVIAGAISEGGASLGKDILEGKAKAIESFIAGKVEKGTEKQVAEHIYTAYENGGVKAAKKALAAETEIKSAAIKSADGTVYEGVSHADAISKAPKSEQADLLKNKEANGLFKTKDGKLITRAEANKTYGITHSEEVPHLKAAQDAKPTPKIETPIQTPEEAAKSFKKSFDRTYNNGTAKVKTSTALDEAKAANQLASERSAYIQSKAGEPKSYSSEDIATYNKKAIKAGKEFDLKNQTPIQIPKESPLVAEARKYSSADEFANAQFAKKPEYGMGHRPSFEGMPPAYNLLEGETLPRDVYTHPDYSISSGRIRSGDKAANESWSALQKIKDNPEAEVTLYRAGAKNELNTGDWVTFSKDYAKQSLEGTEKVHTFKAKAKDVIFAGDDINEFGYYPKSKYEEIYNQAHQSPSPIQTGEKVIPKKAEVKTFDTATANKKIAQESDVVKKEGLLVKAKKEFEASRQFDPKTYVKEQVTAREGARKEAKGTIKERLTAIKDKFMTSWVDDEHMVNKTLSNSEKKGNFKIIPSKDVRNQMSVVKRAAGVADQFAEDHGLTKVIQGVKNLDEFEQYVIAKHAKELEAMGKKTGRDSIKDALLVEHLAPEYEKQAQQLYKYSHDLLDYTAEKGLISKETASQLKKTYPDYVPFNRIFTEEEMPSFLGKGGGKASLSSQSIVQKLTGSEREIESPLASIYQKTLDAHRQGEINDAGRMLASYHDLPGNPFQLEKLKTGHNVPATSTISFLKDGVKETWKTTPEIAAVAKNLDQFDIGLLGKIFNAPLRVFKVGTTGIKLSFSLANLAKDQVTAFINSKAGLRGSIANPKNFVEAFWNSLGQGEFVKEMDRMGARGTSFDQYRGAAIKTVEQIRAEKNIATNAKFVITHPSQIFRKVEDIIAITENQTRFQYAKAAKEKFLKQGYSVKEASTLAAKEFREVSVDFFKGGSYAKALNGAVAYLNAGFQGSRTLLRSLKERPAATTAKIAVASFLPVAYVTAHNLNDPERKAAYDDIPDFEKQGNMIIIPPHPTKDSAGKWNVIKIPLSQEIANLNNIVRNGVEKFYGYDSVKATSVFNDLFNTATSLDLSSKEKIASTFTPQAIKPSLESFTNTQFFTGAPIVPDNMKNLDTSAQFKTNKNKAGQDRTPTSGTVKLIADKLGFSPLKTENWIRETFGGVSDNVVNNVDTIMSKMGKISPDEVGGQGILDSIKARFDEAYGGKVQNDTYTSMDDKIKEFSTIPEGQQRTEAVQEYVKGLSADERKKFQTAKLFSGLKVNGVAFSDSAIKGHELYSEIKTLQDAGKTNEAFDKIDSLSKEDLKSYNTAKAYYKQQEPGYTAPAKPVNPQQDTFNQIQDQVKNGDTASAKKTIDNMSDADYANYVKLRTAYRSENSTTVKTRLNSDTPEQAIRYMKNLPTDEQQRIVDNMTDAEYAQYQEAKKLIN